VASFGDPPTTHAQRQAKKLDVAACFSVKSWHAPDSLRSEVLLPVRNTLSAIVDLEACKSGNARIQSFLKEVAIWQLVQ